jgi:hypothetical protein
MLKVRIVNVTEQPKEHKLVSESQRLQNDHYCFNFIL